MLCSLYRLCIASFEPKLWKKLIWRCWERSARTISSQQNLRPYFPVLLGTLHPRCHSLSKVIYPEDLHFRVRILQVVPARLYDSLCVPLCPALIRVNGHLNAQSPGAGVAAQPV